MWIKRGRPTLGGTLACVHMAMTVAVFLALVSDLFGWRILWPLLLVLSCPILIFGLLSTVRCGLAPPSQYPEAETVFLLILLILNSYIVGGTLAAFLRFLRSRIRKAQKDEPIGGDEDRH